MKFLSIGLFLCLMGCFEYIPVDDLNGKILCDESKNCYKLEWQDGYGDSWRFKVPVKIGSDTTVRWIYMDLPE